VTDLHILIGTLGFEARFERARAPLSCSAFEALLPFEHPAIQARWSGQAAFVPLGLAALSLPAENATRFPAPGELLLYPGGISEVEVLIPYGPTAFASKAGPLAGNHFLTIVSGNEQLEELGRRVLWEGAQQVRIRRAN
jgi:Protein of unknown function (DUF3830)